MGMSAPHPRASARAGGRQGQAAISIPTPLVSWKCMDSVSGQWKLATRFPWIFGFPQNVRGGYGNACPPPPRLRSGRRPGRASCHFHTYPFGFTEMHGSRPRTVEASDPIPIDLRNATKRKGGYGNACPPLPRPPPRQAAGKGRLPFPCLPI